MRILLAILILPITCFAQTTQPTTRPTKALPADQMLTQMLKSSAQQPKTLQPSTDAPPMNDLTSGFGAVAPGTPTQTLMRERTFIVDRTGRLTRGADNSGKEFTFDSDGKALKDPPVVILPNLNLMMMEDAAKNSARDLRFRITGVITEYRGRNYILIEKAVVVPDTAQSF